MPRMTKTGKCPSSRARACTCSPTSRRRTPGTLGAALTVDSTDSELRRPGELFAPELRALTALRTTDSRDAHASWSMIAVPRTSAVGPQPCALVREPQRTTSKIYSNTYPPA
jgi:hypothetical protein